MSSSPFLEKLVHNLDKVDSREIQRILENLAQEKTFFQIVLENMDEGVIVCNPQLEILYLNQSAKANLIPKSKKNPVGKLLFSISPSPAFSDLVNQYSSNQQKVLNREFDIQGNEGSKIYSLSIYPAHSDENDELLSIVFIFRDITLTKVEQERQKQSERISSLATLTAGVAHEIKNPLNAMGIHAQLLRQMLKDAGGKNKKIDLERLDRSSSVIQEEIKRLTSIVEHFLETVRPSKPQLKDASINDLVKKIVDIVKPELEQSHIHYKIDLDPDIPKTPIDQEQLKEAFLNVIKNSIEAIEKDNGMIGIRTYLENDSIHIEFTDNGVGIRKEQLALIFEPYYTTKDTGTGLGLMNVFRVVREHQGEISVHSEENQGTIFTITFPLLKKVVKLLPIESENSE